MSVGRPNAAVVFGAVTPDSGDIQKLSVHLGGSKEVSSFTCLLSNASGKYSIGGSSEVLKGAVALIYLGRGVNCPLLLTGKVERRKFSGDSVDGVAEFAGRCKGERLFRKQLTVEYVSQKGEEIVKDIIDNYAALGHTRSGTELIEDTDTTFEDLSYSDAQAFDVFRYIAQNSSKAGAIGYESRIAPDGLFEFFPKGTKNSSVILTDHVVDYVYDEDSSAIRDKIKVQGVQNKQNPVGVDTWTDCLLGQSEFSLTEVVNGQDNVYTQVGPDLVLTPLNYGGLFDPEHAVLLQKVQLDVRVATYLAPAMYKVTYQKEGGAETTIVTDQEFSSQTYETKTHENLAIYGDFGKNMTIRFYTKAGALSFNAYCKNRYAFYDTMCGDWSLLIGDSTSYDTGQVFGNKCIKVTGANKIELAMKLTLHEARGNMEEYPWLQFYARQTGAWDDGVMVTLLDTAGKSASQYGITVGKQWSLLVVKGGSENVASWQIESGFDWTQICEIRFDFWPKTGVPTGSAWIDVLCFNGKRFEYTADAGSSDPREYSEVNESLLSDLDCECHAEALLAKKQEPAVAFPLTSRTLDYGDTPILACDMIPVILPRENIDGPYPVANVEYVFIADDQSLVVTINLDTDTPQIADYIYRLKYMADFLAKNKKSGTYAK